MKQELLKIFLLSQILSTDPDDENKPGTSASFLRKSQSNSQNNDEIPAKKRRTDDSNNNYEFRLNQNSGSFDSLYNELNSKSSVARRITFDDHEEEVQFVSKNSIQFINENSDKTSQDYSNKEISIKSLLKNKHKVSEIISVKTEEYHELTTCGYKLIECQRTVDEKIYKVTFDVLDNFNILNLIPSTRMSTEITEKFINRFNNIFNVKLIKYKTERFQCCSAFRVSYFIEKGDCKLEDSICCELVLEFSDINIIDSNLYTMNDKVVSNDEANPEFGINIFNTNKNISLSLHDYVFSSFLNINSEYDQYERRFYCN
ncbi:hypothetical protein A0H76_2048 [Hepatospora eriocheir]|uniref:Uncharacterized protein n=1 Tax=Hepatospora eriocheir TaxID=1081669 RepID=A0A1X0QFW9_9MICR|nr:hypothetical protein A0H76_2048 [Hepatospora eriocheir]